VGCSSEEPSASQPADAGTTDSTTKDVVADVATDTQADAPADAAVDATEAGDGWTLVWSDEFDGAGLADSTKWDYEVGKVRNNEAQYYTKARVENAHLEGGSLVITALKESYQGSQYTSASLITKGLQDFHYGRLEVRAKIPTGKGSWPAIWLLGTNIDQVGWPACGEIDVMENVGFDPDAMHCTVHTQGPSGHESKGDQITVTNPFDDFHLYQMEWDASQIVLSVDGTPVLTYPNDGQNPWPFDKPQYLLLNLAIGGSWGGQQGIDDAIFPLTYAIDYVRYFQKQ